MKKPPLPVKDGLNPSRIRLPPDGMWPTVGAYLLERFADQTARVVEKVEAGEVVDSTGARVTLDTAFEPGTSLYLYRDPPHDEAEAPFSIEIIYRDDTLVVVDKPHFMASTPRGSHVVYTALVQLRRRLNNPDLAPAHRLDRLTAGVLLFTARPEARAAYQRMFELRRVRKTYEAVAPVNPDLTFPLTRRSRIVKQDGVLAAFETAGEPNSVTDVELLGERGGLGRFRLRPETGKTHQLRVHMAGLDMPIIGDNYFPAIRDLGADDYSRPLQLVARTLEFDDPYTLAPRRFDSARRLDRWSE